MYSLADALLLKPLPFAGSERVVRLGTRIPGGAEFSYVVYPDLVDYRRDVRGFSDVSAFAVTGGTALFDGKPVNVRVANVEESFQRMLAMRPLHGRLLAPGEFSGGAHVIVLTHSFWQQPDRAIGGAALRRGGTRADVPPSVHDRPGIRRSRRVLFLYLCAARVTPIR